METNSELSPLKDNPEFFAAIGRVTVQFSKLEFELSHFISRLLNSDEYEITQFVTSELSFKKLIAVLMSLYLYRVKTSKDVQSMRKLLTHCSQLEEKRNIITHSFWRSFEVADFAIRRKTTSKFKKGFDTQAEIVHISDLHVLADEIKSVAADIARRAELYTYVAP